jgi:hypothetical protein
MKPTTLIAGRAAGALIVLAALPLLASCTPAERTLTAVRAVNGEPVVLIAGCADFQIDSITVHPTSKSVTASASGPERELKRSGSATAESLPLFGAPPAGWTVVDGGLTALVEGQAYGLAAYANGKHTVPIGFTATDLATLGAGEVLVGDPPSGHEKVTEKEFQKRAEDAC